MVKCVTELSGGCRPSQQLKRYGRNTFAGKVGKMEARHTSTGALLRNGGKQDRRELVICWHWTASYLFFHNLAFSFFHTNSRLSRFHDAGTAVMEDATIAVDMAPSMARQFLFCFKRGKHLRFLWFLRSFTFINYVLF